MGKIRQNHGKNIRTNNIKELENNKKETQHYIFKHTTAQVDLQHTTSGKQSKPSFRQRIIGLMLL